MDESKLYKDQLSDFSMGKYPVRRNTLLGIMFGAIFPIVCWLFEIIVNNVEFSVQGIWALHLSNPVHFIIDFAPLVWGLVFFQSSLRGKNNHEYLHFIILERNKTILKNAQFAKKIGEGDFSIDIASIDKEDMLGNSLLIMRNNLVATYQKENEQNWIAKGKEVVGDILRHHNNIEILAYETIVSIINYVNAAQGAFYLYDDEKNLLVNIASYAFNRRKYLKQEFKIGQGLVGQAAYERDIVYRREIPKEYITISSGILGDKKPATILLAPLISDEKLQGVIEFASLEQDIPEQTIRLLKELSEIIAQTIFNLKVNTRTEKLLKAAQEMTEKLLKNEDELRKNAEQMKKTQLELQDSNRQLEDQIAEVERGQKRLHSLLENASEVISIYDEDGIVKYVSPSVIHILGYNPSDIIGKNEFELSSQQSIYKLKEEFDLLLINPGEPRTFEYQYEKNNGEIIWLETTGRNLLNNLAIQGILYNTRDITVRKIAEKAQRMSGEMQALSENSPDMILRLSPDGKFFYSNPVVQTFTGVETKEIIQKTLEEVSMNKIIVDIFKQSLERVKRLQNKYETETHFPTINGDKIVQFNAIPEFNKENELETILFVAHDITERKQIEMEIEEKNKSITESINYAQRIQSAIIPDNRIIVQHLPKSFIFYQPRDVVSGDFPWFFVNGDDLFIAAVDCTGHGVPGALLSFVGYFLLNSIVDHDGSLTAGKVLDLLHIGVRKTLKQDRADADARDGMDIALCKINFKKLELHYAGAHRPLYYINNKGELKQYKPNAKPIGGIPSRKSEEKDFEDHLIRFELGERIFFFSDGLPDQIGGEVGRKYQAQRIRDIIVEHPNYSMSKFYEHFLRDFVEWKGDNKQIDDVLLVGIEF